MARSFDLIQTSIREVVKNDDVSLVLNELGLHPLGYALPLGIPFRYIPVVERAERTQLEGTMVNGMMEMDAQAPLTFTRENGTDYDFPLDPIIAVNGKNVIARRYVAKGSLSGTVKESWSLDDWEITIAGVMIGATAEDLHYMMQDLREVLESGEVLGVRNAWLNEGYGITQLVIDSWQFPHTKGLTNQSYSIRCYSDTSINILEEEQ